VSEAAIVEAQQRLARLEGIWTAPEAAATIAALAIMHAGGRLASDARVVLVLTGAGIKNDPPVLPAVIDLTALASGGGDDAIVDAVIRTVRPRAPASSPAPASSVVPISAR
jgi:threonine synthase